MTTPIFNTHHREHTILEQVRDGMKVYDANNNELGTVDYVYLGEASPGAAEVGDVPETVMPPTDTRDELIGMVQRAFDKDDLPKELRDRLLLAGFVHVDVPGLFAHNRYVLSDQIAQVTGEGVILRATRQELVKDETN